MGNSRGRLAAGSTQNSQSDVENELIYQCDTKKDCGIQTRHSYNLKDENIELKDKKTLAVKNRLIELLGSDKDLKKQVKRNDRNSRESANIMSNQVYERTKSVNTTTVDKKTFVAIQPGKPLKVPAKRSRIITARLRVASDGDNLPTKEMSSRKRDKKLENYLNNLHYFLVKPQFFGRPNTVTAQKFRCKIVVSVRCASIAICSIKDQKLDSSNSELKSARPFTEIPGPKALPIIGNIFKFIPGIGEYSGMAEDEVLIRLRSQYGKIVRLEGIPNRRPCVFLFDAELCERLYRLEGPWPVRTTMECLRRYCMLNKDRRHPGLFISQGEEWYNLRSRVNQSMMQPRTVRYHVEQVDKVARDFIDKIREMRDSTTFEMPMSFNNELNKWALESICLIAMDHRLHCFESNLPAYSDPQRMIQATVEMFDLFYQIEHQASLWNYYNPRKFKRLFRIYDTLTEISNKYIANAVERLKTEPKSDNRERSVLERLLIEGENIARSMAQDMLFAGIDTTATTTGKALYMIATHPNVQETLRAEVDAALPQIDSAFTYNTMNEIPYLKACIQETLRISPLVLGTLRTIPADVVLAGYRIPKGVDIIAVHSVLSKDEEQFPEPDKFIPERWIREDAASDVNSYKDFHPFACLPFSFGPRSCVGRRFAELQMQTLMARLIRRFRLEWHHGPLETKIHTINSVTTPLQFTLLDR